MGSEKGKMTDLIRARSCRKKPAVITCVLNLVLLSKGLYYDWILVKMAPYSGA